MGLEIWVIERVNRTIWDWMRENQGLQFVWEANPYDPDAHVFTSLNYDMYLKKRTKSSSSPNIPRK
jgi:hypothetical protein